MNGLFSQMKWQFSLLQKNNIVGISFGVTLIYGLLLFFLRNINGLDVLLVSLVLNDPSVIGYFFIALAIYTEMKLNILQAIFVTPVNIHHLLISKIFSISIIGLLCSLGLALSVKGFDFDILNYSIGSFGICLMSSCLGLIMLTFADEFLKFAMLSVPVFLIFINGPLLQYLGVFELGWASNLFPIQGSLDLIDFAISGTKISLIYAYTSILLFVPVFYVIAYKMFLKKIVHA